MQILCHIYLVDLSFFKYVMGIFWHLHCINMDMVMYANEYETKKKTKIT